MRFSLKVRYTGTILALIVALVTTLTVLFVVQTRSSFECAAATGAGQMEEHLRAQLQERGRLLTGLLSESLVSPLDGNNVPAMHELARAALIQQDVVYVYVYDEQGRIVQDGTEHSALAGRILDDPVSRRAVEAAGELIQTTEGVLDIARPVYDDGRRLGGVRIGLTLAGIQTDIQRMHESIGRIAQTGTRRVVVTILAAAIVLAAAGVVLSLVITRSLTRPIEQLIRFTRQIGHGNYELELPVERADEIGDLARSFREMSHSLRQTSNQVQNLSNHDPLTALPNRLMFREFLEHTLAAARRGQLTVGLLFIDLDQFKKVNDTLGHDAGDALLKEFAQRLRRCTRGEDIIGVAAERAPEGQVARLGGDEFTVLLPSLRSPLEAAIVARRILGMLTLPFEIAGNRLFIGASIGITVYPNDGDSAEALIRNADMAMYHAKDSGRNGCQFYTAEMNRNALEKFSLENELRLALDRNELEVFYQPQVDGERGEFVGMEALVRWRHPVRGLVSPGEFIPLAEETGLIQPLGEFVLRSACASAARWRDQGSPLHVGVNVSSVQILKNDLVGKVRQALEETGLDPSLLHLELTETAIVQDEEQTRNVLEELKKLGVEVWMDDFGTGYSSLSYLRRFPIDGVKIDRSFIREIAENEDDHAITSAIIGMARSLRLTVTAEGVENDKQLAILRRLGCDRLQGFLFGQPIPEHELINLISA